MPDSSAGVRLLRRFRDPSFAVLVVLALGAVLRLAYFLVTTVAITPSNDSARYLNSAFAPGGMFTDQAAPSGYPLFLKAIGWLPERATAIPVVQHLIGLLTAYALWVLGRRIARRLGVSDWWAVPGAAFVALSGELMFFEHAVMTETVAIALLVALALVTERLTRSGEDTTRGRWALWAVLAGLVVAWSYATRSIGGPTGVVLIASALLLRRGWRTSLAVGLVVALSAFAGVAAYTAVANNSEGGKSGFGAMDGWYLYARTSAFADCKKIDPPRDLRALCDTTPVHDRKGLFAYVYRYAEFDRQTPAVERFQWHPNGNSELREFGRRAILAQPFDYARTVTKELARYFAPNAVAVPPYSGPGTEFLRVSQLPPQGISAEALALIDVDRVRVGPLAWAADIWAAIGRIPGFVLLAFVILPPVAVLARRSRTTAALLLPPWLAGLACAAAPVIIISYEYRYGLPAQVLLAMVGPLSAGLLWTRWAERHERLETRTDGTSVSDDPRDSAGVPA